MGTRVAHDQNKVLVVCALRSSRVDGPLDKETLGGIEPHEIGRPPWRIAISRVSSAFLIARTGLGLTFSATFR